ncbi:MAG: hypothetical protein WKG00_07800 [Polyangiaceae bacterium]
MRVLYHAARGVAYDGESGRLTWHRARGVGYPLRMQTLACPSCGAPLTPASHEVRVRCAHCGATVDVTSEGVARAAAALQRAGIRVPDKPMTMEEIHAKIAVREGAARAARKRAIVVSSVCLGVAAAVALALVLVDAF